MSDRSHPTVMKRFSTALLRATMTLSVIGVAAVCLVVGIGLLNDRAAAVSDPEGAPPVPVSVAIVKLEDGYSLPRRFVGQIEPRKSVDLSFELGGSVDLLLVEEGQHITAGQEIARLDTRLLMAEKMRLSASRAAYAAQLGAADSRLTRATRLQKEGFTSQQGLDEALATRDALRNRIAETDAALQSVRVNMEKSVIKAPFDGQVAAQNIDGAETIRPGQEIVTLVHTKAPEFRVGLPLDVATDALEAVEVEIAGQRIKAALKSIRPDIDPETRTRTAIFTLETSLEVAFGQTGALTLRSEVPVNGLWVPMDALQAGEGSVWNVLIVVDERLASAAVEILHIEDRRAYVHGTLENDAQIVISGGHRVVPGQAVTPLIQGG